jgi:hypothetical protein
MQLHTWTQWVGLGGMVLLGLGVCLAACWAGSAIARRHR